MATSWWRPWRVGIAGLVAMVVAACAFVYRFNTLGGTLGGFDNDHFIYLIRTDMLLEGEQPLRDFADAELRGAWPALTYAVSAWAQQLGGRNLLSEAYLTTGLLALAYAVVFLAALELSKRWFVALLAVAGAVATAPKLYNYQKVLVLALGVWALRAVVLRPSVARLAAAAAVTAVATLFRHDYGIYVAAGIVAALVAGNAGRWCAGARHVATYAAFTGVCLLPSLAWVHYYEGLREYVASSSASVTVERARTELTLPVFDSATLLSPDNLLCLLGGGGCRRARSRSGHSQIGGRALDERRSGDGNWPVRRGAARHQFFSESEPRRTVRRRSRCRGAARGVDGRRGVAAPFGRGAAGGAVRPRAAAARGVRSRVHAGEHDARARHERAVGLVGQDRAPVRGGAG
jgi:hypothetical protein